MLLKEKKIRISFVTVFVMLFAAISWLSTSALAQTETAQTEETTQTETAKVGVETTEKPSVLQPFINEIKGIAIGMTAEEVKDKLGKAKTEDAAGLYYVFSKEESMQITLDADNKVRMIAAYYVGDKTDAPTYAQIFGSDAAVEKQADGKIYKLVDYPNAGYWIAYNSIIVQDEPLITVTMQKMR